MNLVAFSLILICCHAWAIEIDDNSRGTSRRIGTHKTKLEDALERLKSTIRNGDSELGIPPLDPFSADKIPVNISDPGIKINLVGEFTNVKEEGLSSYIVNAADFKLIGLKVNFNLSWPLVVGSTNYSIDGNVSDFEIYGQGGINAAAHDFRFQTDINLGLKDGHVQITTMSLNMSLKALDFEITGFKHDDEYSKMISQIISLLLPGFLDQKGIQDVVAQIIMEIANGILGTMTLEDILKLLG